MPVADSPSPIVAPPSVPVVATPRERTAFARFDASRIVGAMTVEEYVALERRGDVRYEYIDGKVVRVSEGSYEHNHIATNTMAAFSKALEQMGADCEALGSNQKIAIDRQRYLYPDGVVVCGAAQIDPHDALQNPTVILEVLSPSTEREDRADKFRDYQRIPSLRHYILIEQHRPGVTHFEKLTQGLWAIVGDHTDLSDSLTLELDGKQLAIPLTTIYHRVALSEEATPKPNEE